VSTIRDIARRAGVSVSTASLALNGSERVRRETRQRVLDAASALDYHPMRAARSLSSGRTWSLHLLDPALGATLSSGFFTRFLRGLHDGAHDAGFTLTVTVPQDEDEARTILKRLIAERWSDGVVLMNPSEHDTLLADVVAAGFPHVLLGRSPVPGVSTVDNDNVAVAHDATHHLLAAGRRAPLLLNGPAHRTFAQDRERGFRSACAEAGVEPNVLHVDGPPEAVRPLLEGHIDAGAALDAVVAVADPHALVAARTLKDRGVRVPSDVAIVGMNNDDLARYTDPSLSSVDLGAHALGLSAVELLLAAIDDGSAAASHRLVGHTLTIRESSP
jgi:DNA-binding LacI/PurR family transcriptional regulator